MGPGTRLGDRYQLQRPLASGGMAQVWVATDTVLDRTVAVKILHPHLATDAAFVVRFRREAVASARLSHPSIVAVFDTVSGNGVEAMVMELIEGRTLRALLDDVGALPIDEALHVGISIASALDEAHRAGIVHRDIKPANIMVATDNRVLVTDFGIAKAGTDADLTVTGTLLGTAKYLSPEQVTGEPIDPRSDLYSLGVLLFEALTGNVPFRADTDAATALARLHQDPPALRTLRPNVPAELDAIVAKLMARRPDDRFTRASAVQEALVRLRANQAVPARPFTGPTPIVPDVAFDGGITAPAPKGGTGTGTGPTESAAAASGGSREAGQGSPAAGGQDRLRPPDPPVGTAAGPPLDPGLITVVTAPAPAGVTRPPPEAPPSVPAAPAVPSALDAAGPTTRLPPPSALDAAGPTTRLPPPSTDGAARPPDPPAPPVPPGSRPPSGPLLEPPVVRPTSGPLSAPGVRPTSGPLASSFPPPVDPSLELLGPSGPVGGGGPGGAELESVRRSRRSRLLSLAAVGLVVVLLGAAVAAGWGPFSSADDPGGDDSGGTGPAEGAALTITSLTSFDPQSKDPDKQEKENLVSLATDGDRATAWTTELYRRDDFGGLKDGVGLLLTLGEASTVRRVDLVTNTVGYTVEVYVGDTFGPDSATWGEPAGVVSEGPATASVDLSGAKGSTVLLWVRDTGLTGQKFRFELAEVTLH